MIKKVEVLVLHSWSIVLYALLFTLASNLYASKENIIDLVKNGESNYRIVVVKDAMRTPKFAAKELQKYIEKVSGAKLEIRDVPSEKSGNIFVGESKFTKAYKLNFDNVNAEGFIIKTIGDDIVIMGRDTKGKPLNNHWRSGPQTGTLYGVYQFIEQFLGVHWFMPTEIGEYVPHIKTIQLPEINIKDEPAFVNRNLGVPKVNSDSSRKEVQLWKRRNKIGRSLIVQHSHNWYYLMPCHPSPAKWSSWLKKRYPYDKHPEYYALVDGRRIMTHNVAVGRIHNGQICSSNKDVQKICAEVALEYFKDYPDVPMVSVSANDGGGYCECEKCTALDVESNDGHESKMSDRMMEFYNGVAEEICKKAPDKLVGAICYGKYIQPPKRTRPHKNVCLWDVHNGFIFSFVPKSQKIRENRIRDWGKLHNNMFYYSSYNGSGFWSFPTSTRTQLSDLIKFTKLAGYRGYHLYELGSWGGNALNIDIASKMLWDPSTSLESLLEEHYEKCYGKDAGEVMRKYHDLIEASIKKFAEDNTDKLTTINNLGVINITNKEKIQPFYKGIRGQARTMLDNAVKLAPKGNQKKRAELASINFEFVELTLDALDLYDILKKSLSLKNALKFKAAVDKREVFLEKYKNSLAISYHLIRRADKENNLPLTTQMANYYLSTKGKKRAINCETTKDAIVIDGKLDDVAWQKATKIGKFVKKDDAAPVTFKTTLQILRDDKNIYIALECEDPSVDKLLEAITTRDGKLWTENEIELFFDPSRDGENVWQLIFNSAGTQFDLKHSNGKNDVTWNGNWTVKTTKGNGRWFAEVKIPFSDITTPIKGDIWGVNICRVRKTTDGGKTEYSQVTPTFGLFMKPEKFADLIMH